MEYICPACELNKGSAANLNKHLSSCEKYDNWYKKYIPPKGEKCDKCGISFITKEYLLNHMSKCFEL